MLGERFRIQGSLGRGGMGEVWRALDLKLRVNLALKRCVPICSRRRTPSTLSLRQEVRSTREVVSPNVCRVSTSSRRKAASCCRWSTWTARRSPRCSQPARRCRPTRRRTLDPLEEREVDEDASGGYQHGRQLRHDYANVEAGTTLAVNDAYSISLSTWEMVWGAR